MTEIWNLNAICRCCHADGNFSDLSSPCTINGSKITILDLLKYTFGLYLQTPVMEVSNTICDECLKHLREAAIFKKQIEDCEWKFQEYCKNELFQHTTIKLEPDDSNKHENESELPIIKYELEINEMVEVAKETKLEICPETKKDIVEVEINEAETAKTPNVRSEDETECKIANDKEICKYCKKKFHDHKSLKKHISNIHTKILTCNICDLIFKKQITLDRHMRYHSMVANPNLPLSKMTSFDCQDCNKSYNTLAALREHRNVHTRENIYICDICQKEFLYKNILKKHILLHMGAKKPFMCDTCGHTFNDVTNLNKHYATVHLKLRDFECKLCTKKYASKKSLMIHMRLHTGERPFKCEFCTESFVTYSYLTRHQIKHDRQNKYGGSYICTFCNSVFDHRGIYTSHLRTHVGERYRCFECDRNFSNNFSLKRHLTTHVVKGLEDYSCDICRKKFTKKSQYQCHNSRFHRNVSGKNKVKSKKVSCDLCQKIVLDINKHMNTHYNRRHQCEFCDKAYPERNTLNRHVKQIHNGVRHKCDVCGKEFIKKFSLNIHKTKIHKIKMNEEQ